MALFARLHPLIVHFPIALVMVAAAAECVALVTADWPWRAVAVVNLCGDARWTDRRVRVYRTVLFVAAMLIAVTGHLGGLLVWGADFLRL